MKLDVEIRLLKEPGIIFKAVDIKTPFEAIV